MLSKCHVFAMVWRAQLHCLQGSTQASQLPLGCKKNKLGFNCYHLLQCVNTPVDKDPQPAIICFVRVVEVGSCLLSVT